MRILALTGLLACGLGAWLLIGAAVTVIEGSPLAVEELRDACRWLTGGLVAAALGFWDR